MDARIESSVVDWTPRTCSQGYRGLRELADAEFTGAVQAPRTWLFMLNGRVIGVVDGSINDFEDANLSAFESPDPAVPLLFAMLNSETALEAKYYTGDTSIADVDRTLSDGGFTGYIELSDNVLSGDYYVTYYGGKSMSLAFVGTNERLITGEEAFNKADDEVGIYEVRSTAIELVPIPDDHQFTDDAHTPSVDTSLGVKREPPGGGDDPGPDEEIKIDDDLDDRAATNEGALSPNSVGSAPDPDRSESRPSSRSSVESVETPIDVDSVDEAISEEDSEGEHGGQAGIEDPTTDYDRRPISTSGTDSTARIDEDGSAWSELAPERDASSVSDDASSNNGGPFTAEKRWQETVTIPSLDPKRTRSHSRSDETVANNRKSRIDAEPTVPKQEVPEVQSNDVPDQIEPVDDDITAQINRRTDEISTLRQQLATTQTERDDAERERDRLQRTIRELRADVEQLETELARESTSSPDSDTLGKQPLSPVEALEGTNVFVRYRSKGAATLADVRAGNAERDAVNENLRLQWHTNFDEDEVVVDGESFRSFLTKTIQFRFVEWIVRDFIYEIQETGHTASLQDLIDAIPNIDRAEFDGSVSVRYTENGEEFREQCSFDVVLRDAMGHPLIVANVNDSRDPATETMVADLVADSNRVTETSETLACAVMVTASFFEPSALETAAAATSSGFFGGGSRKSFVKLSRKSGYHLCLVESREGSYYVNVPEL